MKILQLLIVACYISLTACGGGGGSSGVGRDWLVEFAEKSDEAIFVLDKSICSWSMMTSAPVGLHPGGYTARSQVKFFSELFSFEFSIDRNFAGHFEMFNEQHNMKLTACTSPNGDKFLNIECEVGYQKFQNFPVKVTETPGRVDLRALWLDKVKSESLGFPVNLFKPVYKAGYMVLTPRSDVDVEFLFQNATFESPHSHSDGLGHYVL